MKKRIESLVKEMYFSDSVTTHKEIAAELSMTEKSVAEIICGEGVRPRDMLQRHKDKWLRTHIATFTLTEAGEIERCGQCLIFMIDMEDIVPPDWGWDINGRIGDICRACEKEMNARQKKRMHTLRRIGCIVCRIERGAFTQPEIHHLRDGLGTGQRRNHDKTIPLCPNHHRLGGYGVSRHDSLIEWERRHGKETELLDMVNTVLEDIRS